VNHHILRPVVLLSIGLASVVEARAVRPIHSLVGSVESIGALDARDGVRLVIRQAASQTRRTILVPRPVVSPAFRGVAVPLMTHGPSPRIGDTIRATGSLLMGQPLIASVVEVRDGPLCSDRCIQFEDGARGYRLWLHRSFFDDSGTDSNDRALWVAMSKVLAQHDRLESSRTAVWLAGPADRLFGYYTNQRQVDAYISSRGTPDLQESVPRLARLAREMGTKRVLILGLPFMPSEWGQVFMGDIWMYFPLQIYMAETSLRRVF
jgi:hypothetical protein